jgi:hypothetical protein
VASVVGLTCEVPGGTSDDGPAINAALTKRNNDGTASTAILRFKSTADSHYQAVLDKTYTLASVLQTTSLNNVAIELTRSINFSPGVSILLCIDDS